MTASYIKAIEACDLSRRIGRVSQFFGLTIEADGPDAFLGERCEIHAPSHGYVVPAEVVGIRNGKVLLMPYGDLRGIRSGSEIVATGRQVEIPVGEQLLGRVIDAFGNPIDDKDDGRRIQVDQYYPLFRDSLNPLKRPPIQDILETGIKAIDTLLTVGRGQRVGIFSGSGVGKSSLLGMIARHMNADINVIALIGERGREVLEFIHNVLGDEGLKRSVVIVATSDQPALVRSHAALAATAIAEYFRDSGKHVVLTMDSVTRFAMAQREIGLAIGEPPTARGYTPSVFALLPQLLERGGTCEKGGTITAFYTVLVEGDDINDPIGDHVRAILDGGFVLSRELASRRHYPAIDILHSNSRLLTSLLHEEELKLGERFAGMLDTYERARDIVDIGAYRSGSNPELDRILKIKPRIDAFLRQGLHESVSRQKAMALLQEIVQQTKTAVPI